MSATYKTGPRAWAADKLRGVSHAIWTKAKLGEPRYLGEYDLALIRFVGAIDNLANALDRPY